MSAIEAYTRWSQYSGLPDAYKDELIAIVTNHSEIEDRFSQNLEFGTGGLRGKLGAGSNRMNLYTVGKATQGLALYLKSIQPSKIPAVAIAYDSRHMSPEFSLHTALVLAANGVRAYLFSKLEPTPLLSYAVRYLRADAGIVVTASHNPPDYNGYKVYGADGGQILNEAADGILAAIESVEDEFSVYTLSKEAAIEQNLLVFLDDTVAEAYQMELLKLHIPAVTDTARQELRIVYTPLHGTGNVPVREALVRAGYTNVKVVPEQELPNPNFSTVKSPNPEEAQAFTLAMELGKQIDAHLLMGTDPDADRVGVVVRNSQGEYVVLTGNQTGGLLLDFLISRRKAAGTLPQNGVVLKTIVTSELGRVIAEREGLKTIDTLTGFKYIADKIGEFETQGDREFLFGYEESYGYLIAPFVRDKDAVQTCLLIAEMTAYYLSQGITLYDALLRLYERVGFFREALVSLTLPGQEGMQKIKAIMEQLRTEIPVIAGWELTAVEDYLSQKRTEFLGESLDTAKETVHELHLPVSDVLKFFYSDGSWVAIRPSGTEPKIKLYVGVQAPTLLEADAKLALLTQTSRTLLEES